MLKVIEKNNKNYFKGDFPGLHREMNGKPLAYLDTASSAQKPHTVIAAMNGVMEGGYSNIHRGLYEISQSLTAEYEAVRRKVAEFISAQEKEIVFTRNTTEALNLVAQSWGRHNLKKGDEIILSVMEHHANIVPWQLLRDEIGVEIKIIPMLESGALDLDAYKALLSDKTRLVSLVHTSNALGTINPVKEMIATAKNHNPDIICVVDGTQAVVHNPVDVLDLSCDFMAFTGHKLYGPTGVGVVYGRYDLLNNMPPYQGGGDMIESVSFEKTEYREAPFRFEAGTPAIVEVIGLGAAIDYMNAFDMADIQAEEQALLKYGTELLSKRKGITIHGDPENKIGILSFTADYAHPSDIGMILDQCGVAVRTGHHCCMPLMSAMGVDQTVRASLGLYSTQEDLEALNEGLEKAERLLS